MFKTDLSLVANPGRPDFWFTGGPLVWQDPTGLAIVVPTGFRTDLASIPRFLEAFPDLDVNGKSRRPGVLHDWLYGGARWIGKDAADALLYQALLAEGMDKAGATTIYQGVHLFGQSAWDEDGTESMVSMFRTYDDYMAWLRTSPRLNPAP
jgi:hypothetical protein